MSSTKTVAFFGATGGSTAPCLAHCLKAGYSCTALVRNADKLTTLLTTSHAVTPDLIASNLTITVGDIRDPATVSQTLFPSHGNCVDVIMSGIGCYPVQKKGSLLPQQEDPTLCTDGVTTILTALRSHPSASKPLLIVLSTTGISKYGRDVPLLMTPLYAMLGAAHKDKKAMEDLALGAASEGVVGSCAVVRASLLTNGAAKGAENVKWDVEDGGVAKTGYTISRADVGGFVFERLVKPFVKGEGKGEGKIHSITH